LAGAGLALGQDRHGRIVGVDALGCEEISPDQQDKSPDQQDKRPQRGGGGADPISERRDVELDALASIEGASQSRSCAK